MIRVDVTLNATKSGTLQIGIRRPDDNDRSLHDYEEQEKAVAFLHELQIPDRCIEETFLALKTVTVEQSVSFGLLDVDEDFLRQNALLA
jgi:hypothetical protein